MRRGHRRLPHAAVEFLLLFALWAIPTAACARDTIRVALQLEPPSLDPTSGAANATDEVVYATIFEGLVRAAADGSIQPLLAAGWTVSPDARHYEFGLRPNVRFQDGRPLTASDVVFSLDRARAAGSSNAQATAFGNIASIRALDSLRVAIDLTAPDAGFLTLLSFADAVIVSPASASTLATRPIGTGPYRLTGWRRGDRIMLARNPLYWGTAARTDRVAFRFIADPSAAYAAMRAGDIDIFPDFPAPETLPRLAADPALRLAIGNSQGKVILALNQRDGPLAKLAVRRAIARAIDRRAIIDGAMYGYGTPIGSHFSTQSPDYVDLTGRYPFDPAAARRLLAQAGSPRGFALTLKLPPPTYARRTGEILAAQLRRIGIRVTIRSVEWAAWLDEVFQRHDFDMTIVNHAEPFDYDIYGRPDYYFGYDSPAYRALLNRLRGTIDPAARHAMLGAIQRRLADDAVNGFLFQFPHLGVQARALDGVWANTPNQSLDLAAAHFAGAGGPDATSSTAPRGRGWAKPALIAAVAGLLLLALLAFGPRHLAGRLLVLAGTLLAASLGVFLLIQIMPGDPAAFMMGLNASPQAIAALHTELGLGGPPVTRYLAWVAGLAQGDFGISYTYRVPVAGLLWDRLSLSLPLALLATGLSVVLGVGAGYLAVSRRSALLDHGFSWLGRIGVALPNYWLAILLVLAFAIGLGWADAGGFPGWSAGPIPVIRALALPVVALALPQAAILMRVTRASLLEAIDQDYVRTARAKGLRRAAAIRRHALPNALGPVLTVLGLQIPFLIAGSAIVENVFFLPGLGRLVIQAITQRDLIVVQSVVMLLVALTILSSFVIDMAQGLIDPRIRDAVS
ncbi:ABC transporter substrate-binding protein [Sphingomonas naphthae]|uniref:ABC transporter substrate-binding protein n=1 Tax=Sphingomonas naphthae TaxID=1813468 RepID=A0ABY7TPN6_9SPHN|nr:ABC transporter substrate-binding protein [Sphingomonas naphthae]WCT75199.1 ABC transporter substrate-binding protein [Sphingomonas naphthae]